MLLIAESRGLLIGEGVRPETATAIRARLAQPACARRGKPAVDVPWARRNTADARRGIRARVTADDIVGAVASIERDIQSRYPKITRIYIEARSISAATRGIQVVRPGS